MTVRQPDVTASLTLTERIAPLHALDTEFLLLEDADECEQFVASRLDRIPVYRKSLRSVPLGLGRPVHALMLRRAARDCWRDKLSFLQRELAVAT